MFGAIVVKFSLIKNAGGRIHRIVQRKRGRGGGKGGGGERGGGGGRGGVDGGFGGGVLVWGEVWESS